MRITVVKNLKDEIQFTKKCYKMARKIKDTIYDMDSLDYKTRYKAHLDFKELVDEIGEYKMNIILDEFTTWKKYNDKLLREKYLIIDERKLYLFLDDEYWLITPQKTFASMVTMPKTKWIINCLEHL